MLIGIIADSHDNMDKLRKAIEILNEREVTLALHAGDFIAPFISKAFVKLRAKKFVGIFGNNDGEKFGLREKYSSIGSINFPPYSLIYNRHKILMLHDGYLLNSYTKSEDFNLIVHAHSHKADIKKEGKTLIVNPGELGGWLYGQSSFALVDLDKDFWEIIKL
jgi:putative phosphoesterase